VEMQSFVCNGISFQEQTVWVPHTASQLSDWLLKQNVAQHGESMMHGANASYHV